MSTFHGEDGFFGPPKVQEGFKHHKFLSFDGKQHPKNIGYMDVKITPEKVAFKDWAIFESIFFG